MRDHPRTYFCSLVQTAQTLTKADMVSLWAVTEKARALVVRVGAHPAAPRPTPTDTTDPASIQDLVVQAPVEGEPRLELEVCGLPASERGQAHAAVAALLQQSAPTMRWAYAALCAEEEKRTLLSLVAASRELTSSLDLGEVLDRVATQVRRTLEAKLVSILLEQNGLLRLAAADGAPQAYLARAPLPVAGTVAGKVLQSGMPLVIEDVRQDPGFLSAELAAREGLCTLVCLPLRGRRKNLGVLNVYSGEPRRFEPQQIEVLALLGQLSAAAIENAALYREAVEAGEHLRESEKLAALGRLSAGLAHEIKNPLNTIAVLLYAMQQQAGSDPQTLADLHVIEAEIRRLALLVDQFLDFARPRPPNFCRQDVGEIVEETLLLVRPQAVRDGIRLLWRARERSALVWADGAQLKQVFLNLALNAMQAMSRGGTLSVAVQRRNGGVVVEFTDTGPGIRAEVRERIFEPFFTTRRGGHGLGLAISLRIVENHSGRLWLDSQPGKGTTATVWLPA
ncbi:MAG: ATP-binding protein [Candidatus Binatia bacterium]|nr:ATP-binding protein [Candidatus Binatia bacterium]